jgi:uncharacterized protein YbaR (Trm112 family)
MRLSFFEKLVCPFDKQDLILKIFKHDDDKIIEGLMTCVMCQRYYPIVHGIPIMSPDEYREKQLELPILEKWGEKLLSTNDREVFQLKRKEEPLKIIDTLEASQ